MIGQIVFAWLALNYAFAAQFVYLWARRDAAPRAEALMLAAAWPVVLFWSVRARG